MKKFILVDNDCNAADQQHIEAGKYHMGDGDSLDRSVAAIMESGNSSPILAMFNYPGAIDAGLKLFLLHVWDLEDDGYSIVKEVEMPAITAHHKLAFAIKAVGAINVVHRGSMKYPHWCMENVIAADPDVIVDMSKPMGSENVNHESWKELTTVSAVKNNRIVTLDDSLFRAGPRLPEAVKALARVVHEKSASKMSFRPSE